MVDGAPAESKGNRGKIVKLVVAILAAIKKLRLIANFDFFQKQLRKFFSTIFVGGYHLNSRTSCLHILLPSYADSRNAGSAQNHCCP